MEESLLEINNERRKGERRYFDEERRVFPDRRINSIPVSEERRKTQRRVLNDRRSKDRRWNVQQNNSSKYEKIYEDDLVKSVPENNFTKTSYVIAIICLLFATFILYQFFLSY